MLITQLIAQAILNFRTVKLRNFGRAILVTVGKNWIVFEMEFEFIFLQKKIKVQWDERSGRMLLADNTVHSAADQYVGFWI